MRVGAHHAACALLLAIGFAASTARAAPDEVDAVAPISDLEAPAPEPVDGPSIAAVVAATYRAAGLERDPAAGWIRRARLAGLVPWVTVRTGRDASWKDTEPDVGRSSTLEVRATWRLDRLVFDGRELQVASTSAARRRERRRLASRAIRAYFEWRRAASTEARAGAGLRAAEAVAELDALTDGWFSEQLETPHAPDAPGTPGATPRKLARPERPHHAADR